MLICIFTQKLADDSLLAPSMASSMTHFLPFAVASKCVQRSPLTGDIIVQDEMTPVVKCTEVIEDTLNGNDSKPREHYYCSLFQTRKRDAESKDGVAISLDTEQTNYKEKSQALSGKRKSVILEDISTRKEASVQHDLLHPSKLRYAMILEMFGISHLFWLLWLWSDQDNHYLIKKCGIRAAKWIKEKQRNQIVEQHIQQLKKKQLTHLTPLFNQTEGKDGMLLDQQHKQIVTCPVEIFLASDEVPSYQVVNTITGEANDEDEEWLKEHWRAQQKKGKAYEE